MRLGYNLVNSSDAFKALVAATSATIAIAKYKYVIFSLYRNLTLTTAATFGSRLLALVMGHVFGCRLNT
jgi:hypothetical protein